MDFIPLGIGYRDKIIGYTDLASTSDNTAEIGIVISDNALWGRELGPTVALHILAYGSKKSEPYLLCRNDGK